MAAFLAKEVLKVKMAFIVEDDFSIPSYTKAIFNPLSIVKSQRLVVIRQFLDQLDFIWLHTEVSLQNFAQGNAQNVDVVGFRAHFELQQQYYSWPILYSKARMKRSQ